MARSTPRGWRNGLPVNLCIWPSGLEAVGRETCESGEVYRHSGSRIWAAPYTAARAEPSAPGFGSLVTFLAEGRWEPKEAAGGQGRRRRNPALARFTPGFGPGFCRMSGRHPHCHRALHVATRHRKMADLRPCRHNNGPHGGLRVRQAGGGTRTNLTDRRRDWAKGCCLARQ